MRRLIVDAPVFEHWARSGLVWLPEVGMGYHHGAGRTTAYDEEYFRRYEEMAETEMGRRILQGRLALVERWCGGAPVVDVGVGCGAFVEARPRTWGYDVNPSAVAWLMDQGRWMDPRKARIATATFWDSIEHIPDVHEILANVTDWVFCVLPIVPGEGPPSVGWKHLRRDEHCWYWTRRGFLRWMEVHGFRCLEHGTPESLLGRLDVETFAFRRVAGPSSGLDVIPGGGDLSLSTEPFKNVDCGGG